MADSLTFRMNVIVSAWLGHLHTIQEFQQYHHARCSTMAFQFSYQPYCPSETLSTTKIMIQLQHANCTASLQPTAPAPTIQRKVAMSKSKSPKGHLRQVYPEQTMLGFNKPKTLPQALPVVLAIRQMTTVHSSYQNCVHSQVQSAHNDRDRPDAGKSNAACNGHLYNREKNTS